MVDFVGGFGVHTSLWSIDWSKEGAEISVDQAKKNGLDFIEIALLDLDAVDPAHTRQLIEENDMPAICGTALPEEFAPSVNPDDGANYLKRALDVTDKMGACGLTGVTYGYIGERTGEGPKQAELDNIAKCFEVAGAYAKSKGLTLGIEAINRYETHLINTGAQAAAMVDRIGNDHVFVHLDTYHMNIEEKGVANGILAAREHLRYIHMSESDRGVPGTGTCDWDEIYVALAAIGFTGALAMESFVNLPPSIGAALSVWRPVARDADQIIQDGLPFLRNKARQYGLLG